MKKSILILGGGTDQLFMIKTAQDMGLDVVCVDANPNAPGLLEANHSSPIDFSETDKVVDYCQKLLNNGINLCGVSTMGSDIPDIVAHISNFFGWNGPSLETGEWAKHKFKMKERFSKKNIPVPRYGLVKSKQDIENLRQKWESEILIIKPTDQAGSRGVRLINLEDNIQDALNYASKYSKNNDILLEEFIKGPQISTETLMFNGIGVTPGFADRVYSDMDAFLPAIMENGGWLPSSLNKEIQDQICDLVELAAKALGITNGVAKGDVVICPKRGPMIIEMAARLSGGDFSESLVPLSTGVNYVKTAIEIAMGHNDIKLDELESKSKNYVANRYFFVKSGYLEAISGLDTIKKFSEISKVEINYKVGDVLPNIDSHRKRTGVFVVKAKEREIVQKTINKIYDEVKFKVDGNWVSGDPKKYSFQ